VLENRHDFQHYERLNPAEYGRAITFNNAAADSVKSDIF